MPYKRRVTVPANKVIIFFRPIILYLLNCIVENIQAIESRMLASPDLRHGTPTRGLPNVYAIKIAQLYWRLGKTLTVVFARAAYEPACDDVCGPFPENVRTPIHSMIL